MTLELIIFIAAILFGILLYWRESQSNSMYRFFNKVLYTKALQMKANDKKGFIYQQKFIARLISLGALFLLGIVLLRFLVPINLATVSLFLSMLIGTLLGTYLAHFIFKSSQIIEEKTESLEDLVQDTIESGKDIIEHITTKKTEPEALPKVEEPKPDTEQKSARERLKDKGLL